MTAPPPVLVSITEARKMLGGIGNAKMYALIRAELVDARRLGGRTLISVASLAALPSRLAKVELSAAPSPPKDGPTVAAPVASPNNK